MKVVLHQFAFSHFNDKARWALSYKGIEHDKVTYLPGPHFRPIRKLTGQTQTPVLGIGNDVVHGSTEILERLEVAFPDPALYPAEHADDIRHFVARFDDQVGPAARTVLFSVMLEHGSYLTGMFSTGKGRLKRALYRATFPLVKGLMAKANGVEASNIEASFRVTRRALDEIAAATAASGYVVGARFTAADLTAAALLAPLANPTHPDMRRPAPMPSAMRSLLDEFRGHPAIAWVNEMYARHRPV